MWTIRRAWARGPHWRGRHGDWLSWLEAGPFGDSLVALGVWLVLGIALAVLVFVLLPLVLFVGELVVLAAGAYALGGRWLVQAGTAGPPPQRFTWRTRGWPGARRLEREAKAQIESGLVPHPADAE